MKNQSALPKFIVWIINLCIRKQYRDEFLGDLLEIHEDRLFKMNKLVASLLTFLDAVHLSLGFALYRNDQVRFNSSTLTKHYFLVAWRNMLRSKFYASINTLGLAVSMAVCLTIAQYLVFELNFDSFHKDHQNIYRVILEKNQGGEYQGKDLYMAHSVARTAKSEIQGVENYLRLYMPDDGIYVTMPDGREPISFDGEEMYFVDSSFFSMLNFPLIYGDVQSVFLDNFNVVITERVAERLFGHDYPIGKTLEIGGGPSSGTYTVTGVVRNFPTNSQFQCELMFPVQNFIEYGWLGAISRYDHLPWFATYIKVDYLVNEALVKDQLDEMLQRYDKVWNYEELIEQEVHLQNISEVHLHSQKYLTADFIKNKGNLLDVKVFALVGSFLLLISWINYINLATARSMGRAREVGIRKSIGAYKHHIKIQFLFESLLTFLISAVISAILLFAFLPVLGQIIGQEIQFTLYQIPEFWIYFSLIFLSGTLFSGAYPAFVLSAFRPLSMMRSDQFGKIGSLNLRKGLIVFQFLVSLFLLSGTYLIYTQVLYMKDKDLGMNLDQLLVVRGPKHIEVLDGGPQLTSYEGLKEFQKYSKQTFNTFKNELANIARIDNITASWAIPGQDYHTQKESIRKWGAPAIENRPARLISIGLDFISVFDLELKEGVSFSESSREEKHIMINETAVKTFGFKNAKEAINQQLNINNKPRRIIGVVKDFHWLSLKEEHSPWVFWFVDVTPPYITVQLKTAGIDETMAGIKSVYQELYPGNPFEYFFLDDQFNRQYQSDLRFGNLFLALTLLAIFIGAIGLLALVSYSASLKVKEIGIRKVLGAGVSQLMLLLSREYLILLAIAIAISIPLTLVWSKNWLENYAYRVSIDANLILLPSCAMLIICLLTVSFKTYTAAKSNPVDSLRSE